MSGKPYPEGVKQVIAAIARYEVLSAKVIVLAPRVDELTKELVALQQERSKLSTFVEQSLDKMDLSAQGNAGFGGRMGWFIAEARRQIIADLAAQSSDKAVVEP